MDPIAAEELIGNVAERMGGAREDEARRALEAVLATLGEKMRYEDAHAVASELPEPFAACLRQRGHAPQMTLDEFFTRVSERAEVPRSFAVEHAQAVCAALLEALHEQARAQLCIDVWPELVRPSLRDVSIEPTPAPTHGSTLASGRPGSAHPISESQPEGAQTHSVVREKNPHGKRKLSSGTPRTGERGLAEGRAGSERPVSESRTRR